LFEDTLCRREFQRETSVLHELFIAVSSNLLTQRHISSYNDARMYEYIFSENSLSPEIGTKWNNNNNNNNNNNTLTSKAP